MAGIGAGYDLSVSTFSPDGRIFQVEYAAKAASNGNLIASLICKNGVLLIVEKILLSNLIVPHTATRIFFIDNHCFAAITGFISDGREIIKRARMEANEYKNVYGENIPGCILAERIAQYVHIYTLAWSERPFGCSILLGAIDKENQKVIYSIDSAGTCYSYKATALGKNSQSVKTDLEKIDLNATDCEEALKKTIVSILKSHPNTRDKTLEFEAAWISTETNYTVQRYSPGIITNLVTEALDALDAMDNNLE